MASFAAMLTEVLSLPLRREFADILPELCVDWRPRTVPAPTLLYFNRALAAELALPCADWDEDTLAQVFSGNIVPEGVKPVAQVYAGHQFGGFVPRLGDGRALLLGEARDRSGRLRDLAFKGSGPTPFARNGDGKAAVGPMLREVIIGEALHALGIPTTRALAVVATGEPVFRERALPGAVLTRVAASHLRVGTFEYVAARSDEALLQRLADYAIARHYPPLAGKPDRYLRLLQAVARRQAELIARWMNVGFIHGVMNTDNMSIAGESIDFGPCAFMDAYDPATVFSSIDHYGRYAYGNQPPIALWNLARLAEALLPLLDADREAALAKARAVLNDFAADYETALRAGQRAKLGLATEQPEDARLIDDWLALLAAARADFTASYRALAAAAAGDEAPLRAQIADEAAVSAWLARWRARCAAEDGADAGASARRAAALRLANPRVIPRNHRVEEALAAATDAGDLGPFERLLAAVRRPFDDDPLLADYATPAPVEFTRSYMTFCGT